MTAVEIARTVRKSLRELEERLHTHPKEVTRDLIAELEAGETELDIILMSMWSQT